MDIITGNRFQEIADISFDGNRWNNITDGQTGVPVVFCETHNLNALFRHNISKKHIVISHNSDGGIVSKNARECDFLFIEANLPKNMIGWYAQNMDVLSSRIKPLPIGLENYKWHKGSKWVELTAVASQNTDKSRQHLLYLNAEVSTNPIERGECISRLSGKNWVTWQGKVSYLEYISNMAKHRFVACPEGNGLDTHRTWEALYLGCIPIVKRRIFTEMLAKEFPLILIDTWADVTKKMLDKISPALDVTFLSSAPFKKHLQFKYWNSKIREKF